MFWKYKRLYFFLITGSLVSLAARADGPASSAPQAGSASSLSNPFVWMMILVVLFLLIVIRSLAVVLLNAARKSWAEQTKGATKALLAVPIVNGLSNDAFYLVVAVIGVEILVILYLLYNVNVLLKEERAAVQTDVAGSAKPAFNFSEWWTKVNRFRPVTEEAGMDMGHDYDGIRELDNKLPPWWKYGFYATMIFAVIYLWRYHVSHSAPLQDEEYAIAVQQAAVQKEAYLKMAANNVDETTVKLLTAPADLEAGKAVFQSTCFACHGKNGEGGVGPNLTDSYWLHGGSIQEVFKTIKYGWPDKGMKSWKDDYSPSQIAQIASYVKSLAGTNPPNAKPPQGTLVK
jgi:cytochrome c oxidase cbb3-type subunit 3